jgi:hypothetical protein
MICHCSTNCIQRWAQGILPSVRDAFLGPAVHHRNWWQGPDAASDIVYHFGVRRFIGLFVLGCAPAVNVAVPPASSRHASQHKVEPARWRLLGAPASSNFIHRLPDGPSGAQRYTLGGDRAEKVNGRITYAKQSFVGEIESSCPSGNAFIHFARNGKVYWSDTFLADAVQIGTTKGDSIPLLDECGPVVIRNPEYDKMPRELWDEHGVHVLPNTEGFRFLHFTSRDEGRAIRPTDQLLVTTDGGQTFVVAPNQPYPKTPEAWLGAPLYQRNVEYASNQVADKLAATWLHRAMTSEVSAMMGAMRLADGTWVRSLWRSEQRPHVLVSLRRTDGTIIDWQLPNCELLPFTDQLLAYCEGENPALRRIYPEARALASPPKPLWSVVADPVEGVLIAMPKDWRQYERGQCPLLRFDGVNWQSWSHCDGTLRAVRYGRLLVCGETCVIRSASDPSDRGIDLDEYTKQYGASVKDAALLDDEVILVAKQPGDDGKAKLLHLAFTARGLTVTRAYDVPNTIDELAFADTDHGAARFQYLATYTVDGGRTWLYEASVRSSGTSACWSEGCAVGHSLLLTRIPLREPVTFGEYNIYDEGPKKSSSDSDATAGTKKDDDSSEPRPSAQVPGLPRSFLWYQCVTGRRTLAPANSTVVTGGYFTHAPGTRALGWRGSDHSGPFVVQTSYILPEPEPKRDDYIWAKHDIDFDFPIPPLITRHYAVLTTSEANESSLVVLKEDGTMDSLASSTRLTPISVQLPDGRGLVVANQGPYTSAFLLDEHGALVTHRWLLTVTGATFPAVSPEGPGVVVTASSGTSEFHSLVAGSQSRTLLTLTPSVFESMLTPCTKPRDPAATLVHVGFPFVYFHVSSTPNANPSAGPGLDLFEVSANQVCLRGATTYASVAATLTAERGVLRGTAIDTKGATPVTCRKKMMKW